MHPPWEMTIDRQRSSTFLMYMLLHDVGEDYWSISYFFYSIFFKHDVTTIYLFFFIASNLAPWPACCPYDRRLLADIFFIAYNLEPDLALDDYWSTTKLFFDVSAMTWCGRGLLVNIVFIMYVFFYNVNEDYWSIFFWCTYDSIWEKTICWYFFFRVKLGSVARMLPLR